MAGARKLARKDGTFQGWYKNSDGARVFFRGTTDRKQTLQIAARLEDDHQQIALGYRPKPKPSDRSRRFSTVVDEYLAWGRSQGGRNNRPWSKQHGDERKKKLAWWGIQLNVRSLNDLVGALPRAESVLRSLAENRAGKTISNYSEALVAFSRWCVDREYLEFDPFEKLGRYDSSPQTERRALTIDEIGALLSKCRGEYRILYELTIASGLRVNELSRLEPKHLSEVPSGLKLEAEWTKNRKNGFQPLPAYLVKKLKDYAEEKLALEQYEKPRRLRRQNLPEKPLVYVPYHPARQLDIDLERAEIPKWTDRGEDRFSCA